MDRNSAKLLPREKYPLYGTGNSQCRETEDLLGEVDPLHAQTTW